MCAFQSSRWHSRPQYNCILSQPDRGGFALSPDEFTLGFGLLDRAAAAHRPAGVIERAGVAGTTQFGEEKVVYRLKFRTVVDRGD